MAGGRVTRQRAATTGFGIVGVGPDTHNVQRTVRSRSSPRLFPCLALGCCRGEQRRQGGRGASYETPPRSPQPRSRLTSFEPVALAFYVFDVVHLSKHGPDVVDEALAGSFIPSFKYFL